MSQNAQQPHYWKDRGPSGQYGVRHQYTHRPQSWGSRGTSSSHEMNQNAQPVEGGNNGAEVDVETEETVEFKPEGGAEGGELDIKDDEPKDEDKSNGPEVKPEDDNNFESELSGSNVVTTGDESGDKSTGPAGGTKAGDDDEFKPEGETNEPEANKFSFGKMLKSSFQQVFKKKSPSPHSQEHDQDMAKTPEQSTDEDTGSGDSTETGNDGEVELGGGAEGGELDTKDDEPKDEDKSNGPEVKPEDDDNFESELSGSNVVTTGDESEDQVTEPEYGTETEENVKVELGSGAEGGDFDTKDDEPKDEDESNGPEVKPEDDNNFGSELSGSNVVTTGDESKDQVTGPADDTKAGDDDEFKPEGETNEPKANKFSFGKMLNSFQQVFKKKSPSPHSQEHDQDMAKTPEQSTDEDTGPEDSTRTEENGEVGESGTKDGDFDTKDDQPEGGNGGPEVQLEDDNNFGSGLFESNVVTTGDKSEDQVTGSGDSTKTGNDDEVELGSGAEGGELDTKDDEPKDEDESNGPEVKPEDNNNFESGSFGSDVVTADDESTDEGTGPEKNTESEDDNEVEESGTKDGEYDTENNQLQREGDKPEGEPENDNNPKSGPSGSDAVTASGESEDQVTEPETNTKTGDDDKVKPEGETNKPGAKKFSFGKMLNSFQQVFKKKPHSTHSQEHDQDMAKTPEQSTDEDTGPEDSTKSGETVEVEESGTKDGDFDTKDDQPEGGNGGPEVQLEDDNNFGSGLFESNVVTTGDKSEDQVTGSGDSTETGNDGEVELGGGAEGGELDTKDDEPKDEDESNGPEVKPEDDDNFGSELSGSDAETTGDESEDQVTEPEYGTETGESGEIKLESGAEGGDFDTGNNNPEGGNGGPEVQPENDNNPKSGTSGSDAETAGEKSGDKSTKPADGTEAGGSGEVKPKVETTQSKTKRPSLSRSMAKSIREGLNKPFPPSYTQKHKQDMAKTSKKSKVKITGPKYDSGTEESDDSDSDSEGEYVFGGYDESENENNKLENDNNPKSGTSGSDAETAGEKSGDKVTGSGDDTGAGDDDEVKLEGGAKGGESKTEDAKLEDGAAKPENDRGSAFKLPWDSVMQDRKSRVHMPQVRRYNRYTQEKSE
ncbi:hypothetical protein BASA61_005821 [Batrachochytrium salamandrivorans]|nr:hypothetical protein BASA61_005821 [Batrachochytrium salamandrivorans]